MNKCNREDLYVSHKENTSGKRYKLLEILENAQQKSPICKQIIQNFFEYTEKVKDELSPLHAFIEEHHQKKNLRCCSIKLILKT